MSQMRAALIDVNGQMIEPPMFAWSYQLDGQLEESNDQGAWRSWTISDRQRVADANLYRAAKAFSAQMKAGKVNINYEELKTQPDAAPGDLHDDDLDA
jgi:hypothetical protein